MQLTEIAVQNLRGFASAARIALAPGLNAFVCGEADPFRLLRAVFFPDPDDAERLCEPGEGARKAAVTLLGKDGHTWRLVRDFAGGRTLLRSDPVTRQGVRVSEEPEEIARLLATAIGVPSEECLRGLLFLSVEELPSRAPAPTPSAVPAALLTATSALAGTTEGAVVTPQEARRKLPGLRVELEKAQRFERAQDALYELQRRAGGAAASAELSSLEEEIAEYDRKLAAFAQTRGMTAGLDGRLKKFPEAASRRDAQLAELARKRVQCETQVSQAPGLFGLLRDPLFGGGLLGGLLCVALAVGLGWRWMWALDLVGFGAAAFGAWRWVDTAEETDAARRWLADLPELEKRVQRQYEQEAGPVLAAMKAFGAANVVALESRMQERDLLEAGRVARQRELDALRRDPRHVAAEETRQRLQTELRSLEAEVLAMGFSRELAAIRRDLQACEEALAGSPDGAGTPDPLPLAIECAAAVAGMEPTALMESFAERLGQYLSALSDRRFAGLRAAGAGVWHVVEASGAVVPFSDLPLPDRDCVYLALRLGLAERVAAAAKLPVVVDEPSVLVAAARRGLFVKMLRSLGARTQVVVRAFESPPQGVVDHVATPGTGSRPA